MTEPTTYLPPKELTEYIANYGILEIPEGITEPYFSPPIALSGFIIQVFNPSKKIMAKIEDRDFFTHGAVATGQVTTPVYGELIGPVKSILVFFQPLGMHRLFGIDMSTITNKAEKLSDFLCESRASQLMKRLTANQSSQHQIGVLNEFFIGLKPDPDREADTEKLSRVLHYIHQNQGGVSVKEIEEYGAYPRKTLERHFKKMVGLSPKVYCQIYRFKCLINLLHCQPNITWAQLADEAGYYDQSHMSRYVKEYLNASPNSIVRMDMALINYLLQR